MKNSVKNVVLTKYDDLFKNDDTRQEEKLERILIVPAEQVFPYARQPYSIDRPTPDLVRLMDSIEQLGIAEPLIVRSRKDNGYEIISGHRRDYCAKTVGIAERPVIVREYTDEEADILVADYNITREDLLPSEKARAYKLKLDAMKRQSGRPLKENGNQIGSHFFKGKSKDILAEQVGESATQIQRYIRLNELIPPLLNLVDQHSLKFVPAVELSYLTEKEQVELAGLMERDEAVPSLKQAQKMRQFSLEGKLSSNVIESILKEEKPLELKVVLQEKKIRKFFPKNYTTQQIEDTIFKLLENWSRKRQHEREK